MPKLIGALNHAIQIHSSHRNWEPNFSCMSERLGSNRKQFMMSQSDIPPLNDDTKIPAGDITSSEVPVDAR